MKTAALLVLLTEVSCWAAEIVVPAQPGDSANIAPFAASPDPAVGGMRYQQVYGASAFSGFLDGGLITAIAFAFEDPSQMGGLSGIDARIDFSTTTRPVDALSTLFADNVGGANRIVLGPGNINFLRNESGSWDVRLDLAAPFYYNPTAGNLLMDVRLTRGIVPFPTADGSLDASNISGDQTSRIYAFSRDALTGTVDSRGLITRFTITAVPEPATVTLILTGVITFTVFSRRKNQPNRKE